VNELVYALDVVIRVLRTALFATGVGVAALAGLAYAVRTRRLSPFGSVGRFVRGSVDPLFVPMERRIVRAGGRPSTAPWWTLAVVIVGGIILISLLGFVRDQVVGAIGAVNYGTRGVLALIVSWTFAVLKIALFVRVISSWFQMSPFSPWIRWAFTLTEWLLRPLRQVVPTIGMIDITPIVAYFVIWLVQGFVMSAIL
jgi:YggT family protein